MANFFEELMLQNSQLTEGLNRQQRRSKVNEQKTVKKYPVNKFRFESRYIFEETDLDELDAQFAVDPDEETEEGQEDEVVLVIDPQTSSDEEIPDNAAEEMIGDMVYKCPICGANYVCDCDAAETESLDVDENGVPTECPICGDDAEQILIGEIAPVEGAGEETELPPVDAEDAEDESEEDDVADELGIPEEEEESEEEEEEVLEDSFKRTPRRPRRMESRRSLPRRRVKEDLEDDGEDLDILEPTEDIDDAEALVVMDDDNDADAPAVSIDADNVNLYLDDKRFESLVTKMIRENYHDNPSFKITKVSSKGSKIKIEYLVREGRKTTKGRMVAEGFKRNARVMNLKFKDKGVFTEAFTKRPAIVVECVRIRNKVIPTKLAYDYKVKVNESLYRVVGKVGNSENFTKATRR